MYTCARCKSKITKQKKTHKNYINWDVAVEGVKLARVFFMNRHLMLYGRIHTSILKKYTCILLGLNYLYGGGGNNCSGGGPRGRNLVRGGRGFSFGAVDIRYSDHRASGGGGNGGNRGGGGGETRTAAAEAS
jgi:hypothetical protein